MHCIECGSVTSNPKFCSRSCSAKTNNKIRGELTVQPQCLNCQTDISKGSTYCNKCKGALRQSTNCSICGCIKTDANTRRKDSNMFQGYCNSCAAGRRMVLHRDFKTRAVEYKGGCCEKCGYKECYAALDFHHLNPEAKDFNISSKMGNLTDEIKKELDVCILVCSNCHRQAHANIKEDEYKLFLEQYAHLIIS